MTFSLPTHPQYYKAVFVDYISPAINLRIRKKRVEIFTELPVDEDPPFPLSGTAEEWRNFLDTVRKARVPGNEVFHKFLRKLEKQLQAKSQKEVVIKKYFPSHFYTSFRDVDGSLARELMKGNGDEEEKEK